MRTALEAQLVHVGEYEDPNKEEGDPKFFITLRRRVHERLKQLNMSSFYGTHLLIAEAAILSLLYLSLSVAIAVKGSYLLAALLGLVNGRLGFIMHCGNHCSASNKGVLNILLGLCMNLIGGSSLIWRYQHQVSHHMYPNDPLRDKDCHSGKPLIRLHAKHSYHVWHYTNVVTTAVAMSAFLLKWFLSDVLHFIDCNLAGTRVQIRPIDWLGLIATKSFWLALHIALPAYYHGMRTAIYLSLVFLSVGAYYLGGTFIVNHIQEGLEADPKRHWAERQVLASANWASRSKLWNWASGGLNHQIEHHIFPSMSIYCYPYIQDVVETTSKEFGLTYRNYNSYTHALTHTAIFLYRLGVHRLAE